MRRTLPLAALLLIGAAPQQTEHDIQLSGFDRIRVDGPFEVHVARGSARAVVSGGIRAVDRVSVRQEGGTLIISASLNSWGGWPGDQQGAAPAVIEVSTPALRSAAVVGSGRLAIDGMDGLNVQLNVTGAGTLAVRNMDVAQLSATLAGTGAIAAQGKAKRARFYANGAGGFDAADLLVDDLTVTSESGGASRFAARYTADITNLGLGEVTVKGDVACMVRGPGPVGCGKTRPR